MMKCQNYFSGFVCLTTETVKREIACNTPRKKGICIKRHRNPFSSFNETYCIFFFAFSFNYSYLESAILVLNFDLSLSPASLTPAFSITLDHIQPLFFRSSTYIFFTDLSVFSLLKTRFSSILSHLVYYHRSHTNLLCFLFFVVSGVARPL